MDDKPYFFQELGAQFLTSHKQALLADEMGLGKTIQTILAADVVALEKVLIICPSVARINWEREFRKWSKRPRNYRVLERLSDKYSPTHNTVNIMSFDYALHNITKLTRGWAEQRPGPKWDLVVVDEAHFLKNPAASRSRAIMGKYGLIHKTKYFWLLTGTPAPNNVSELWVYLYTFGATKLGLTDFTQRYCMTVDTSYGLKVVGNNSANIPELKTILKKIMLRRYKKDVMKELPPIHYNWKNVKAGKVDIEILPSFTQYFVPTDRREELKAELHRQAQLLTSVFTNMDAKNEQSLLAVESISSSVSTLRRYIGLQKVAPIVAKIKQAFYSHTWDKLVIFAIHADVIEGLRVGLREFDPVTLYGKTPPAKRQKNIDKFQNPKSKCKVFIGNIMAAGTAINLTAASTVYIVEADWVPGNNAQAIMRVHRIGQQKTVNVNFVTIEHSIDAHITHVIKKKIMDLMEIFD